MLSLSERQNRVLFCVIEHYNTTGDPVGSALVAGRDDVNVSSATVRNVMSELEELGLLQQPHTSAGRVPTAAGIRYYVDHLYRTSAFNCSSVQSLARQFDHIYDDDLDYMARSAGVLISSLTQLTSLVALPRLAEARLREIRISVLPHRRVVVVLITDDGHVFKRVVRTDEDFDESTIQRMQNYINAFASNLTLRELRRKIRLELQSDRARYRDFVQQALTFGKQVLDATPPSELYVEGTFNIFDVVDASLGTQRRRSLLRMLHDKQRVIELLDQLCDISGSKTLVGSELQLGLGDDFSLIVCGYHHGGDKLGVLGVLGPLRMDYARLIPLVDQAARLLSVELSQSS